MSQRPIQEPIGRKVANAAKTLDRAFAAAMAGAGGSQPGWLILLALKQREWRTQKDLAKTVGIEGSTLTHHLDGLESSGLVARRRHPEDRRALVVELTDAGDAAFDRMRKAAMSFDRQLRGDLNEAELQQLRELLDRLVANVNGGGSGSASI
jgi:MarR family transcriptional regulator for hemolysin